MPRLPNDENTPDDNPLDHIEKGRAEFTKFVNSLIIAEIRSMLRRLQEHGVFQIPAETRLEDLDYRSLMFIKRELRDTLRTLGGGR